MSEILAQVTRGPMVESVHRGSVAVTNGAGELLYWAGDPGLSPICVPPPSLYRP